MPLSRRPATCANLNQNQFIHCKNIVFRRLLTDEWTDKHNASGDWFGGDITIHKNDENMHSNMVKRELSQQQNELVQHGILYNG